MTKHTSIQDVEVLNGFRLPEHDTISYGSDWPSSSGTS
jgi:hypothetical protein